MKKRTGWDVLGIGVFLVMVFPVFWMVSTAFKPADQVNSLTPTWIPLHPTIANFKTALDKPYFWQDVKNSLIIVTATVAISIALALLAAVALARFRFTGRDVLAQYHLVNTLTGVILTEMTFVLPFCVWTLRGFLVGIPKELEEAGMVDGSTRLGVFFKLLLPLMAPGLVATSVFAFITTWNEFIFANLLLNDQRKQTVTIWLSHFYGTSRHTDWGALMAASTLTAIPVVIFFLLVQRRIAFGLTAGAVKA
jgi:N,N'-diacetylchitobiose transport system permease protein